MPGLIVILFLADIVCAIFAATTAADRNRSGVGFFFFGLFFGPIGLLAALVAPAGMPKPIQGRVASTCPRCGIIQNVLLSSDVYECWRCDQRVRRAGAQQTAEPGQPATP